MKNLGKLLLAGTIGISGLVGCDANMNTEASSGSIDGTEVRVIRNIRRGTSDGHTIEIYNEQGDLKARLEYPNTTLPPKGFIQYDDRTVEFRGSEILKDNRMYFD